MPPFNVSRLNTNHFLLAIIMGLSFSFLAGCSGPVNIDDTEEGPIYDLVNRMLDEADDEPSAKEMFAEGSLPPQAERERYTKLAISIVDDTIEFTDSEATFQIQYRNQMNGELIGTPVTWTAVQVGEDWKLKDAPLPPGN